MIGEKIIKLKRTESTNTYAVNLLGGQKPLEGILVYSDYQSAGHGVDNNHWESEKGKNVLVSIILYPDFLLPSKQFLLNKMVSLSILDYLKGKIQNNRLSIKWPNDIYIDELKIAGILINNTISGNTLEASVVGIGLNVNQELFISNAPNPVSLKMLTNIEYSIPECINELCFCLENRYSQLKNNDGRIDTDYFNSLFRFGKFHNYKFKDEDIIGKIIGTNEFGKLILEKPTSEILECDFKEIVFLL